VARSVDGPGSARCRTQTRTQTSSEIRRFSPMFAYVRLCRMALMHNGNKNNQRTVANTLVIASNLVVAGSSPAGGTRQGHASIREHGGEPSSRQVDELLDERNELNRKLTLP
jgi:hypothetical protein